MTEVHLIVPDGIDDPRRPSGGNAYDRIGCRGLGALGWAVQEHSMAGRWPEADQAARAALAATLARVPTGGLVLIDGILASLAPEVLEPHAERLGIVVLMHMALDEPREVAALAAASAIVATSMWTKQFLIDRHEVPADRVHVVPPGVIPAGLAVGTPAGGRLICVGALTPVKGQDLLLKALAVLDSQTGADARRWRCEFVATLDVDAAFAADVRRAASEEGLGDRVRFTGALTPAELDAAYASADLLVLASRAETYGMVVTEALARGLPVIATNVGGVPEALGRAVDGTRPGILVPPEDPQALGAALGRWLDDPRERQRLRAAARSRRQTLASWQHVARGLSDVLQKVAG